MDGHLTFSIVAAVIMLSFAAIVLHRFALRRHVHSFFWGIGLLMFGVSAFAEGYLALAWSAPLFRLWYLFGAMLNAGWLGHGSMTLLVRRPAARYATIALVLLSLAGAVATAVVPLNSASFEAGRMISAQYKEILPPGGVRLLTPFFNIYGAFFLIGGAVYSALQLWRKKMATERVVGNVLIGVGALVIASAGTLTRFISAGSLPVSELAAATLMFAGFMLASAPARSPARLSEQATPSA